MVEIRKVTNKAELREFINFRTRLYKDCQQAVPYLFLDEVNTLSSDKNASFECCEAEYFVAVSNGETVGRVACVINHRANEQWNSKTVRFGWLDFVDDVEVLKALLGTVEAWGRQRGMTSIVGPMGFTDMDREGMLVEGFNEMGNMYTNYNYAYYPEYIEKLDGWAKDNDYVEYKIRVPEVIPEKFLKVAEMIEKRYNLHARKLTRHELLHEGYGQRVFELVNATYNKLYGYSQLSDKQIDQLVDSYIKLADLNLVTVVEDWNNGHRMVGFGITFPSFSEALRASGGKLLPLGWWRMLKIIKWHTTDTVDLLLIGVLPEYRSKGANALIFCDLIKTFQRYQFKWAQAMPQMESNEGVRNQWQYLDAEQHRRHRCYKKNIE